MRLYDSVVASVKVTWGALEKRSLYSLILKYQEFYAITAFWDLSVLGPGLKQSEHAILIGETFMHLRVQKWTFDGT